MGNQGDQVSISPIFYEQLFLTKVFLLTFYCLQFGFVIFWRKDLGTKAAHKKLVKLTPDIFENKIAHFFKKVAQKVSKLKKIQNIYNKAQIESPKYLH
jgi:hypothetical protein